MPKKLKEITFSHQPGVVGFHLFFHDAQPDHYFVRLAIAAQMRDKITQACNLAAENQPTGDAVQVSEFVGMSISKPQEH